MSLLNKAVLVLSALTLIGCGSPSQEVNLYSARKEALIKPLLDQFTAETGIKVNLVTGKANTLLTRLENEGRNTPADVLLTTDAGNLYRAQEAGVLQAVESEYLSQNIPAKYRDPDGHWFGLSIRARTIFYAKDRVKPEQLSSYEDLADPKWKGRICIRSSSNIYNQSMLASMIANHGEAATEAWAKGLVANFAREPKGGDRDQIKAVAAGQCDIAIANTYYYGAMLNSKKEDEREAAQKVALFWANQNNNGTHVNISGGAVTKYAKNRDNAIKLLEFLANKQSQTWYGEVNNEYPVRHDTPISGVLSAWGPFRADSLKLIELGRNNAKAVMIMDRVGWR